MKKLKFILAMALAAVMSLSFTSCDKDAITAGYLDGTWEGTLVSSVDYYGTTYYANSVDVCFDAGWTSGTGHWIDYYSSAPWRYVYNRIDWNVRDGVIYITFRDTKETARIRNYTLNDTRFAGEIEFGGSDTWKTFSLVKTSFNSWSNYYYYGSDSWSNYWRGNYGGFSWSKTQNPGISMPSRSADANQKDSVPALIRKLEK